MSAAEEPGFTERMRRIEGLVAEVEATADPAAQAVLHELLASVLELHRNGMSRMLEIAGKELTSAFSRDPLVGSLLLLHDLHPVPLDQRVRGAVDKIRAELAVQGCTLEVLDVRDGVVRVRIDRESNGHHATAASLRSALEEAIWAHAPDASAIEIEGTIAPAESERGKLVQLHVREAERTGSP